MPHGVHKALIVQALRLDTYARSFQVLACHTRHAIRLLAVALAFCVLAGSAMTTGIEPGPHHVRVLAALAIHTIVKRLGPVVGIVLPRRTRLAIGSLRTHRVGSWRTRRFPTDQM